MKEREVNVLQRNTSNDTNKAMQAMTKTMQRNDTTQTSQCKQLNSTKQGNNVTQRHSDATMQRCNDAMAQ